MFELSRILTKNRRVVKADVTGQNTAIGHPANTKTRPNVVSMLVQRRWRWANIETALDQMLAFAGYIM